MAAAGSLDPMGLTRPTAGLLLDAQRPEQGREEATCARSCRGSSDNAYLYVERGYQNDNETMILLAILFSLGGVLMLGGTLTATFLALSDARPDLATLSAVGATPRTRRGVAAAYALVVGFVGALLGAAVGLHPRHRDHLPAHLDLVGGGGAGRPGQRAAQPLRRHAVDADDRGSSWCCRSSPPLIVGLTARSRLPLVAPARLQKQAGLTVCSYAATMAGCPPSPPASRRRSAPARCGRG